MTGRRVLRRTTYLLVGGAVALAFLALTSAVVSMFVAGGDQAFALLVVAVLPIGLVGFLPGLRELQVAGVGTLLEADGVVVPAPMTWQHRWRTSLWTALHQVIGFAAGLVLVLAIGATVGLSRLALGSESVLDGWVDRPDSVGGWFGLSIAVLGCVVGAIGVVWCAGAAAVWAAPVLLGPIGDDRLALAEAGLRREQEYRRLSRDLHDGVGHALSAISLQAEAGQQQIARDPERAAAALGAIGVLAGSAVDELDHALGVLRDGAAPRQPQPGLAQLDALVETHRRLGSDVAVERVGVGELPAIVSRTAYRACAEGLTNAAKHGLGPVHLTLDGEGRRLQVVVSNEVGNPGRGRRGSRAGRGLDGLREQVEALGGEVSAGPTSIGWELVVRLPVGVPRG